LAKEADMGLVNMLQAKTSLSKLVEAVESGAEKEIIIARNGKPAARLVPLHGEPKRKRQLGLLEGKYPPLDYEAFQALDAEIEKMFLGEEE
jgi:prevent-host-death family protein